MESIQETQATIEQDRQDWVKRTLERNIENASRPDSIVIVPVGGRAGYNLVNALVEFDRAVNNIVRATGFTLDAETVIKKVKEVQKLAEDIWEEVREYVPRLYGFDPKNWRELNDTKDAKIILAQRVTRGQRVIARVIVPREENVAKIVMAVKVLNAKILELQASSDIDSLNNLAKIVEKYKSLTDRLNTMTNDLINTLKEAVKAKTP
mgnify:FL=1